MPIASVTNFFQLNDVIDGQKSFILKEKTNPFRGLGTYIFAAEYERDLILQVPHPIYDEETVEEGTDILKGTNARALFISGTHRKSNTKKSPCSGNYYISDVAHFDKTFFQEAHRATLHLDKKPVSISIHGMSSKSKCDIILSDGTNLESTSDALVNRLRNELVNRGESVGSCNNKDDKELNLLLCGKTNVQGRLSNKSPNVCGQSAKQSTGLFLHIEQKINVRKNPENLINALTTVIPKIIIE